MTPWRPRNLHDGNWFMGISFTEILTIVSAPVLHIAMSNNVTQMFHFEFHIKVRRSLMLFIIAEGCFVIILTSSCSDYSGEFISFKFEV